MTRIALETLQLEAQRAIAKEGLRPFTRRTGLAMGVVRSLSDGRDMSVSSTLSVAEALGFEVFAQPKRFSGGLSEPAAESDLTDSNAMRAGFLPLPWHEELGFTGSAPVAFSASWLASEGLAPEVLKAVVPTSANISLAEPKNIVAVLDTSAAQKGSMGQWCYREGTDIGICRAAFDNDVMVLFSGTEDGHLRILPRPAPPGFKILGRVVWLGLTQKTESKDI